MFALGSCPTPSKLTQPETLSSDMHRQTRPAEIQKLGTWKRNAMLRQKGYRTCFDTSTFCDSMVSALAGSINNIPIWKAHFTYFHAIYLVYGDLDDSLLTPIGANFSVEFYWSSRPLNIYDYSQEIMFPTLFNLAHISIHIG